MPVEEYNSLKEVSMFIASIFAESKKVSVHWTAMHLVC